MGRPKLKKPSPKCKNGCRRVARFDGLCKVCHAELSGSNGTSKTANPEDSAVIEKVAEKMTDAEAENWGRLFAEFTAHKQAAQVYLYQQQEVKRESEARIEALERKRQIQLAEAQQAREQYEQVTGELCKKYKKDRQYTIIDVESRVIREERPSQ